MPYIERNAEGYPDPTASLAFVNIEREERAHKWGYMPLVYICSAYRGDVARNAEAARRYCAFALTQKALPIAPHLLFPQFLRDDAEEERELARYMGLILLRYCRELWFFGDTVSDGMRAEINRARLRNMPVRRFTADCEEVPI